MHTFCNRGNAFLSLSPTFVNVSRVYRPTVSSLILHRLNIAFTFSAATSTFFCFHHQTLAPSLGDSTSPSKVLFDIASPQRACSLVSTTNSWHRFPDSPFHRLKSHLSLSQRRVHTFGGHSHNLLLPSRTLGIVSRIFHFTVSSGICRKVNLTCIVSSFNHQTLAKFPGYSISSS